MIKFKKEIHWNKQNCGLQATSRKPARWLKIETNATYRTKSKNG